MTSKFYFVKRMINEKRAKIFCSISAFSLLVIVGGVILPIDSTGKCYSQEKTYPEYGIYDTDLLPSSFFKSNREKLMKSIGDSAVAIFYAGSERIRNNDVQYKYRQGDDFFYLTGCSEPNSLLILAPKGIMVVDSTGVHRTKEVLFVMPRDPSRESWTGKRLGPQGAKEALGFDAALPNKEFKKYFLQSLNVVKVTYIPLPSEGMEGNILEFINEIKKAELQYNSRVEFRDPTPLVREMRQVKSPEELAVIERAAQISANAHRAVIIACKPGMYEYQLQAIFEYSSEMQGAEYVAYPCIDGSGENSTIFHYETNRRQMKDGDVVVMDCGCEYHNYASDITRTIPVSGKFSQPQLEIYNIVLAAHDSAVSAMRPRVNYYMTVSQKAVKVIQDGLLRLGIIKDKDEYGKFFNHGLGHPLGLDVHDVWTNGVLRSGEVWTVEPGIYIPANSPGVDPKYWNIGIRIEDDILITDDGHKNITDSVPVEPKEIEKLMKK